MDVLSDLLHRARASHTLVRQVSQRPPWAMGFAEVPALSVVATLGGQVSVRLDGGEQASLTAGDIALISKTDGYSIADDPATPVRVVLRHGKKHAVDGGEVPTHHLLAPRTYGDGLPGASTLLRGTYDLRGGAGRRLLDLLPPLAVVPAGVRTKAAIDLLADEVVREEPGQDAVLDRLLDLVLVVALRAWCARPDALPPAWYRALVDPDIGAALRLMHGDPAHRWTVGGLAAAVGMSRAAFAARFRALVGVPPLAYLTDWRLTTATDLLRDTESTVASVAREVGYADAFAFSVAFKRAHGVSPTDWRRHSGQPR